MQKNIKVASKKSTKIIPEFRYCIQKGASIPFVQWSPEALGAGFILPFTLTNSGRLPSALPTGETFLSFAPSMLHNSGSLVPRSPQAIRKKDHHEGDPYSVWSVLDSNHVSLRFACSVRFVILVLLRCRLHYSFTHHASASLHLPQAALRLRAQSMFHISWTLMRGQGGPDTRKNHP